MEEKKGRGVFFGQPVRILTIVVTLLSCDDIFRVCRDADNACPPTEWIWIRCCPGPRKKSYETTQQFGYNVVEYMSRVSQVVGYGKPFLTDGELDLKKTVDITDLEAASGDQSEDTSYTVKTLREMADREGEFSELIYSAENMAYTYDEGASASEASEDSGYSEKFVYLYENGRTLERECGLPASGVSLADYARENSDKPILCWICINRWMTRCHRWAVIWGWQRFSASSRRICGTMWKIWTRMPFIPMWRSGEMAMWRIPPLPKAAETLLLQGSAAAEHWRVRRIPMRKNTCGKFTHPVRWQRRMKGLFCWWIPAIPYMTR